MQRHVVEGLGLSLCLSPVRLFATVIIFLYLSACLLVHPFLWWSISFSVCLCLYLSLSLFIYPSINRSILLSFYLSMYLPLHLSTMPSMDPAIHIFIYPFKHPSICPSFYVSIKASFYPSLYPCVFHSLCVRTIEEQRQFLPFRTPWSSVSWLFLFSDSSHLCSSICPYCRKFDF